MALFLAHTAILLWACGATACRLLRSPLDRLLAAGVLFWANLIATSLVLSGFSRLGEPGWYLRTSLALALRTFVLGMFWTRTTGTGAFLGLVGGIASSAIFHAVTTTSSNLDAVGHVLKPLKGGYLAVVTTFPSEMAQNFWLASFAFIVCFVLTLAISLATKSMKTDDELKGLVYSLTPKIKDGERAWYLRPATLGIVLLACCVVLNILFR